MNGYKTPPAPSPGLIGQSVAIAAGTYTEIVEYIAPTVAAAGDPVTVEVKVKNLTTAALAVLVGGYLDDTEIWFSPEYVWIPAGDTRSFTYDFTMPDADVAFFLWSYYWSGDAWLWDDDVSFPILLSGAKTSITITAPDSAEEGATVNVSVDIENVSAFHYSFITTIDKVPDNYPSETIFEAGEVITSGTTKTYTASFTMPDCNTTVLVWVLYWNGTADVYDNSAIEVVAVAEEPPPSEFRNFGMNEYIQV